MASSTTNVTATPDLRGAGERFFRFLELMANCSPTYRAVQHYNNMSDAELEAQGMTRTDVVHRVFGSRMGI